MNIFFDLLAFNSCFVALYMPKNHEKELEQATCGGISKKRQDTSCPGTKAAVLLCTYLEFRSLSAIALANASHAP